MKEVERECLEHDAQEIEHDVEVDDDDRGCTGEFSRAIAKKKVLVPRTLKK